MYDIAIAATVTRQYGLESIFYLYIFNFALFQLYFEIAQLLDLSQ